ncbi:MAG TPA: TspO/MBR family protein [Acidobacteriaceae bacterium]
MSTEPDMPVSSLPAAPRARAVPRPDLALAAWLGLCYAVAGVGSLLTAPAIPTWYATLAKPPLTPPGWVFAPVWTVLYTAMAVAAWLAWRTRPSSCRRRGLRLFCVQLVLNLLWSWIFFSLHRPGLALVAIALLGTGIAMTTRPFLTISRTAGWLMLVYLAWVTFATYLNAGIWRLNP